jgi:hypothetical protein
MEVTRESGGQDSLPAQAGPCKENYDVKSSWHVGSDSLEKLA